MTAFNSFINSASNKIIVYNVYFEGHQVMVSKPTTKEDEVLLLIFDTQKFHKIF